jgi:hypothetical protein
MDGGLGSSRCIRSGTRPVGGCGCWVGARRLRALRPGGAVAKLPIDLEEDREVALEFAVVLKDSLSLWDR